MAGDVAAEVALLVRGFQISQLLTVAAELGIADRIGDQARPAAELAAESGAHPEKLVRLLRALAAFGVFSVDRDDNVSHSPRSRVLRSDSQPTLHYAARFWGMPSTWTTWGNLLETVKTGEPAFEVVYGMHNFEYLKQTPTDAAIFDDFMRHSPDDRHAAVAAAYDFTKAGVVVDVGGGTGGLLRAILDAHTGVTGVLFDQEAVVAGARQVLGPQAERCQVVAGNFFERVPHGGDVYTMAQILHDWSDKRCLTILVNCRAAMRPGARLLVIERVLEDEPGSGNPLNYLSDMQMMALFPGAKERRASEFAELFRAAGFGPPRVIPTRSVFSVVETAVPA